VTDPSYPLTSKRRRLPDEGTLEVFVANEQAAQPVETSRWQQLAENVLEAEGTSVEVVDLRTLVPLDRETVLESVRKTGKAMIVHEDNLTGGFGAEVAAIVAQEAFENLDAPVTRVAAIDTPIPFTPVLEREYLPTEDDILRAARELAAY